MTPAKAVDNSDLVALRRLVRHHRDLTQMIQQELVDRAGVHWASIRTISENARTLKFEEPTGFSES